MRRTNSKSFGAYSMSSKDTRKKDTKRALISSMTSLILCCAMLVGTTFAWFTDSVASGKNKIVAGNLDVELEYATVEQDGTMTWNPVEGEEDLFNQNTLWEPGHAEVVYLRIKNNGTLALKYKFAVEIEKETSPKNVNGEKFKLSQYLQYGVVENQETVFENRAAAIAAVSDPATLENYSKEGTLAVTEEPLYVALVVYMPETVGNEANYRGSTIPQIDLGITLLATQDTVESDSFDNQYDKDATLNFKNITTYNDLYSNQEDGTTYVVSGDVAGLSTKSSALYINSYETTLSLGGHKITAPTEKTNGDYTKQNIAAISVSRNNTTLTIVGEGVVDGASGAKTNVAVEANNKATVNIKGGTYTTGAAADGSGCSVIFANGGATINIYDGFYYTDAQYNGSYWVLNCQDNTDSHIYVYGGTFVNFDPSNCVSEGPNTNFVAAGYKVVSEPQSNGDIWYTVVPE